ncbi:MAG: hemolysin family protein [Acutalibacteraceae bacterium]|nr:hemolysin family protein [Acutalibacteraceae bacterium]
MTDDFTEKGNTKKSNSLFSKLFKHDEFETATDAEDEVINVLNGCCEQGLIDDNCKIMIENIFNFDDTCAGEIMTHRKDVIACEDNEPLKDVVDKIIETGYSRIPVYHEDTDNIVGILYAKDLLKYIFENIPQSFKLTDITREVFYVPSSKKCSELFAEMVAEKIQIAIIVDEYGGTDGIVSLEDLIEFIMGNIQDEFDHEEDEVHRIAEKIYSVEGSAGLDEVNQLLGSKLPENEFDTIAGLILDNLGKVPNENERPIVVCNGVKFTVAKVERRRIVKVLVELAHENDKTKED